MGHHPIDPALFERDDMRAVLARRDIGTLYAALKDAGVSQRHIATLTGQSQSEVSEILKGRQVSNYDLLARIADGLGIPRQLMGLSYGQECAYRGEVMVAESEEAEEMLRRHLLALGATVAFGAPIKGLGELAELPGLGQAPPPSRLTGLHVTQVQDVTRGLREGLLAHGSNPRMSSAAAAWADQLLGIPGTEAVTRALTEAVAEVHTLAAGWSAMDSGHYSRALYHYSRGLELATKADNAYLQAVALACAGLTMLEQGQPNDALKMLQLAQVKAWSIPDDHDRRMLESCARADSVIALLGIGEVTAAGTELAKSQDLWRPSNSTDPRGDQDQVAARFEMSRGRLEAAEPFAVASVHRWDGVSALRGAQSAVLLATIHVQAGEPDGTRLAHDAIGAVSRLTSVSARKRLEPLAEALDARRGTDTRDLARQARQVASTRA